MNPFFCYAASFTVAMVVYQLGWSRYFPPMQSGLFLFLLLTIALSVVLAIWTNKRMVLGYQRLAVARRLGLITIIIFAFWTLEFIYAGGVPLFLILTGKTYDYRLFGIPTLHVLIVTVSSFFTTYLFHQYLSHPSRKILLLYLINLFAAILIMNRGMLLLNVASCVFVYLFSIPKWQWSHWLRLSVVGFFLMLIFGVLGHIRVSHSLSRFYDRSIVYEIGEATESFRTSVIPTELFWTYLYIAQPLGTLQHNMNNGNDSANYSSTDYYHFFNSEWVPDFLSKRLFNQLGTERKSPLLIASHLNASTVYARSYQLLGWTGLILMFLFVVTFAVLYMKLLPKGNRFYITGMATLCTLYSFLIFDNFFVFSGFSFQLAYPILLGWMENKKSIAST